MTTATDHVEVMSDGQPESLRVSVCGLSKGHKRETDMAEKGEIVVPQQDAIAVRINKELDVVIVRLDAEGDEMDHVYVNPRYVPALCRVLRKAARQAKEWASEDAQQ